MAFCPTGFPSLTRQSGLAKSDAVLMATMHLAPRFHKLILSFRRNPTIMGLCVCVCVYIYIYIFIEPGPRDRTASRPTWYGCPPPPQTSHLQAICSISEAPPPMCTLFTGFGKHSLLFVRHLQHLRATTSSLNPVYRHISNISIEHMLPKTCLCTACSVPHTWFTTHCMPLCYMFAAHRLYTQSAPMHTYIILYIICLDGVCTYKQRERERESA